MTQVAGLHTESRPGRTAPDVTVVVPVYNAMPYLKACLASLARQTIGWDRMEVIAVDDGSTDRSGRALDRFARRYPGMVTVIHQPNSGGPAGPCNRALDIATGRYVFFVGADDYLGAEALERLVATADRYSSDVVLGKAVGINGRYVDQAIFAESRVDVSLADSPLPFALANTKLFRRELVEQHKLRYPEDMPVGSDQPFTLEACYRARRVSVLADYPCYYAVWRLDSRNISYSHGHAERLRCVERLMSFAADLLPPGEQRDAVLCRHFALEVAKLLADDLLHVPREVQELVHDGVRRLVDEHLSDRVRDRLDVVTRIRLGVAHAGTLDDLVGVIRQDSERGAPPTVLDRGRRYAAYPGFRDPHRSLPDACFDVTDAPDWTVRLDATSVSWTADGSGIRSLTVTAQSPLPDFATVDSTAIAVTAEDLAGSTTVMRGATVAGTVVRASWRADHLVAASAPFGRRRGVQVRLTANGKAAKGKAATGMASAVPLRCPGLTLPRPAVCWHRGRPYVVAARRDSSGQLMLTVVPVTVRRALAHLSRRIAAHRATTTPRRQPWPR